MNKNKKWYSLFLVAIILLSTLVQPIQAVATVVAAESEEIQANVSTLNNSETTESEAPTEETTSQVVVESTESTEETSSTTEIESSTTSEPTTETTDESTTQSTTEESDVDKDALKKARALAARLPLDVFSLLEGTESFITDVGVKVKDGDKDILDYANTPVSPDATIGLTYNFKVPGRLLQDGLIKSGDFFELNLPSQLKTKNLSGSLTSSEGSFGTYEFKDGKVRVEFNDNIEKFHDVSGTFFYSESLNQTVDVGENTIKIPVGTDEQTIKIKVRPNGGQAISKNGSKGEDNKSISWDVSINTNLSQLKNATVTDPMPEGTTLKNLKIYTQTVDLSGKPKAIGTELVAGTDYTLVDNVVTFIGDYADTNQSFKLVYSTTVNEDSIPAEGGEVKYKNTATLTNEGQSYPATSEVGISYGKLIDKSNADRDITKPGFVYNWTVKYNYGYKALPAKSSITDSLSGTNLEYVKESVVVTTAANETLTAGKDYTLSFKDKEMLVLFPNGLDTAVNINYQTKVPFIVDGSTTETSLKNNVKTDTGFSAGGSGQIAKDGVVKNADIDYNARTIKWTIIVNRYQYDMFNWSLKDTMSSGLTFNKDNFEITSDTGKLNEGVHYRFVSSDAQNFHVEFIGDLATNGTNKSYTITYTTEFDRYQEKFKNSATTTWEDSTKTKYTQGADREVTVKPEYVKDATKGGSYNAVNKTITWTTVANYNQDVLKNATITDPIIGDQTYVEGSAKVFEANLKKDGTYSRGNEVTGLVTVTKDQVSAKLPEDSKKTYILVFETSLEGKVINKESYKNKATYVNNGKSTDVEASVTVKNGGVLATKSGEQDKSNENYAKWTVVINPTQSTLKNVEVIDTPSTNQVIEEGSIAIYETTVKTNGDNTKDSNKKLVKDTDYSIKLTTESSTGQQVLTVKFLNEISRAYVLEYRSLINSSKETDDLTNTVSMTASNEKVEKWVVSSSSKVSVSGGSATGSKASVKIVKLDKNTKERTPLPGAVFELWSIGNNGGKGTLVRSGETDAKGEIKFGNLRANYDYLLVETKAPDGFTVSEELKNGKKVRFKPDATNENSFEELAIQNDMPRIQFQKVDEKTKTGLAGAVFAVKNAKGEYYNGINAKYVAQWVSDKKDISNETKTQLTSGENGFVEVTGLNVGNYSIEELTAPVGYDRLSTAINFEVINDAGMIRLKDAIQPIANKAYETTSLPVQKNWDDANNQDGIRPNEVVITLLADGEKTDKTLKLTKENGWKVSFTGLRKFDADMEAIKYTAEEAEVEDYKLTDTKNNNGVVEFTNTHKPELIDISGKKSWDDKDNQDGIRPKTITVNLLANGKVVASKEVSAADKWAYTFNNQPKFANGVEITYSVTENEVPNYTTTYKDTDINNQYTPGERSISVSKVWDDADNQDGVRSKEVTVQLLADGKASGEVVTLNADNNWAHSWTKLAVKKAGEAVTYTVKEISKNEDYEAKVEETTTGNFIITNTHTPSIIKINGKKVWEDVNNQDGIRPETITVNLLADGKKVTSQELTGSMTESDWTYSFEDLPEFKEGKKIVYTVEEEKVADYKTSIKDYTITNSYTPQITRVAVTKDWADANNQDGKRVKEIIVELYANGKATGNKLTLSSAEKWTASFEKLALKAAGKKIAYTVKELTNVEGYVAKVTSAQKNALSDELDVTVTNSYTPETLSINGEKIWDDADNQDGKRPESITINLLANGKKVADYEVNESTKWKYEFNELPKFENGVEIKYAVQEIKVEDYSATINGFNITNKHTPGKTAINVVKAWDDADNQDGIRPPEGITVKLLANGKATGQTLILSDENKWQADFTDLDVYEKGKIIDYTIEEIEVDGYDSAITGTSEEGFVVTNTHEPEETEVNAIKVFDDADNQDGIRPENVVIQLFADGKKFDKPVTLNEANEWKQTWSNLAVKQAGETIVYTVKEISEVEGYVADVEEETAGNFTITNTHKPSTIDIDGTKVWEDANNQDAIRPEIITVNLLADGEKVASQDLTGSMTESDWAYSFKGLPEFKEGKKIKYTVTEEKVAKYDTAIDGFTITNSYKPQVTKIAVSKVWEDANDKDGIRPDSITVNLLANGKSTGKTLVLTAKDKWQAAFKDLAVNESGKEIKYSVEEVAVKGYTSKVTGTSKTGFVVTNSHTPKEVPSKPSTSTPTKPKATSNGNLPQTGEEQSILALSLGAFMVVVVSAIYIQRRKENH